MNLQNYLRITWLIKYLVLVILTLLISCAKIGNKKGLSTRLDVSSGTYELSDNSGKFILERESGFANKGKDFVVKTLVKNKDGKGKVLERSVTISNFGTLKGKVRVLRPKVSQYSVWFDGKKYFSEFNLNIKKKSLDLKMISPEPQWKGEKSFPFPKGTGVYCFFSQLIECVKATGFLNLSSGKGAGEMNFHIIWDGYPYIQEQYLNLPGEVFSQAVFKYDGVTAKGDYKFTLFFQGHSIFYFLNKLGVLTKLFWVSQGMTLVKKK
jgi:hypothetical protein